MSLKFIDLFSGLGGIRLGFEQACKDFDIEPDCVFTSEIKNYALETLKHNFKHKILEGDITSINSFDIPDFDVLLAGFPCQAFSSAGRRQGFADTRGTLFFEIERIIRDKKPWGFILENVEGLVKHDLESKNEKIGNTLKTILFKLENELGYKVNWKVLDSSNFGVPQARKRIFIVGTNLNKPILDNFKIKKALLKDVLESGLETLNTNFVKNLLDNFSIKDLLGKSIKDKRGGRNNIHSWEIGLKGPCSSQQIELLNLLLKERRKKHWADQIGIDWMDGMPLTLDQIKTFYNPDNLFESYDLKAILDDLVDKGYLKYEYPKKLVIEKNGNLKKTYRSYDLTKPKGYNIVTGKLSFEINKVLDPNDITPTLVATDMGRLVVPDGKGLRKLTKREGLRLCGFPEYYEIPVNEHQTFDLLGNTVVVPVVKSISERLLSSYYLNNENIKEEHKELTLI